MEAAETVWFAYHQRNIFSEKNIQAIDLSKVTLYKGWTIFKNCKMTLFQNSSLGSTPLVLLTRLKDYDIIDLKIELSAININIKNDFRHFVFFCPVNNKWFHSNLPV